MYSSLIRAAVAACALGIAAPCVGQTMSFSVYTDASADEDGVITMWGNVEDNSTCYHTNYSTTANIVSPSGRTSSTSFSGLEASTSLDIDAEEGNFNVYINGTYHCNCSGMTAGYGGGFFAVASSTTIEKWYKFDSYVDNTTLQVRQCLYVDCPSNPSGCGTGFDDVVGLFDACAPGIHSVWLQRKFLGFVWRCEEVDHVHTGGPPC